MFITSERSVTRINFCKKRSGGTGVCGKEKSNDSKKLQKEIQTFSFGSTRSDS